MPLSKEPRPLYTPNASPGQIYKGIKIEEKDFQKGETKLVKSVIPKYVEFCRACSKYVRPDPKSKFSEDTREAVDFLGWDLKPGEYNSAISLTLLVGIIVAFLLGMVLNFIPLFPDCSETDARTLEPICTNFKLAMSDLIGPFIGGPEIAWVYLLVPLLLGAMGLVYFVRQYPLNKAHEEQIRALTYVPEIIGYMTMSMKLVPNLERAIEFAAEHGRGKISEDLKKMIWEVQLGFYNTLSEGLDALAYRWGKFSDEFKRSLMMIRASVLEDSESKRYALLDKTVAEMLESIKTKMENYARALSQPSVTLFYLGVLLPLILIIILPVGSVFSGTPLARPEVLVVLYVIIIPAGTFFFARNVVKNRPPTYEPPIIPDDYPGLPPKKTALIGGMRINLWIVTLLILFLGSGTAFLISQNGLPMGDDSEGTPLYLLEPDPRAEHVLEKDSKPLDYFAINGPRYRELAAQFEDDTRVRNTLEFERKQYFAMSSHDVTPYSLVFGLLLSFSLAAAAYLHLSATYKRKVQLELMQMESEFRESLYILASRMGENKPVEEALSHTRDFLPKTLVADRIYGKTVDNISLLGMPLESAVFDKTFGSLKNIPSNIIKSSMKLLVDSVNLGVNVSARTIMSLSMQLSNQEKVSHMLSTLVREVTSMMQTMVIFIAPIVLGITTTLQKVVLVTLSQVVQNGGSNFDSGSVSTGIGSVDQLNQLASFDFLGKNPEVFQSIVSPVEFVIIVAIYVVELVIIMTYYNTKIEEDNDLLFRLNLAKSLPISIVVFIVTVFVANTIVKGLGS